MTVSQPCGSFFLKPNSRPTRPTSRTIGSEFSRLRLLKRRTYQWKNGSGKRAVKNSSTLIRCTTVAKFWNKNTDSVKFNHGKKFFERRRSSGCTGTGLSEPEK